MALAHEDVSSNTATGVLGSVSVLIAAYNAAVFLERAVHSALTQTLAVLEIVIVNDASTDDTLAVMERLARADSRVTVLSLKTNGGPAAARNAGWSVVRGDWIAVLDADDAFLPHRLEEMLTVAQESRADIVVDNFRPYSGPSNLIGEPVLEMRSNKYEVIEFEEFLTKARPFGPEPDWGLLHPVFRKSFFDGERLRYPTNSRHGEDFLLLAEAFLRGARYVLHRNAGYLYTNRDSGWSKTIINYKRMWRHSEELLRDPRICGRPTLCAALAARIRALKKLQAERDLVSAWQRGTYKAFASQLIANRSARSLALRKILGKLKALIFHE
jgi:succinoglycan biosynthesis protein ExoO